MVQELLDLLRAYGQVRFEEGYDCMSEGEYGTEANRHLYEASHQDRLAETEKLQNQILDLFQKPEPIFAPF